MADVGVDVVDDEGEETGDVTAAPNCPREGADNYLLRMCETYGQSKHDTRKTRPENDERVSEQIRSKNAIRRGNNGSPATPSKYKITH